MIDKLTFKSGLRWYCEVAPKYEGSSLDPVSYAGTASVSENEHAPYAGAAKGINFGKTTKLAIRG